MWLIRWLKNTMSEQSNGRVPIMLVAMRAAKSWDLVLETRDVVSGGGLTVLGKGYATQEDVLQAVVDTLTAPLIAQEKLNAIEELQGVVGALKDQVQAQHEEIEQLKSTQSHQGPGGAGAVTDDIRQLALRVLGQAAPTGPAASTGGAYGSRSVGGPGRAERAVPAPLRRPQAQVHQPAGGAYAPRGEDGLPPGEDE